ncbi:MAG: FAD-dependent oxidoreductase, partial [Hydrogenophaga sp.]
MIRLSELKLTLAQVPTEHRRAADAPLETAADREPPPHPLEALTAVAAKALGIEKKAIAHLHVFKRSFDARKAELLAVYIVDITLADPSQEPDLLAHFESSPHIQPTPDMAWQAPGHAPVGWPAYEVERPVVIGLGPCGLFAALALAQMGFKPIVLERGKPVRERTKDTWGLWRNGKLNPDSNVQYGEGGAGLFSDGKLYSQIKDPRFLGRKVMNEFVEAGAPREILYQAHPHIGTFKLVKVVEAMREKIIALGGEIRFEQQVVGFTVEPAGEGQQRLTALKVQQIGTGEVKELPTQHAVLALGHSSRDTFALLHDAGVFLEAKPFSVGFRIEHPQGVIDRARWGRHAGHPLLGAADYKLVHHAKNGRAVYSFCMCPGGMVVAATSEPGRVVTNGMSQYSRNERNANAGMVVGIEPADFPLRFPQDAPLWSAAFGETDGPRYADQAKALASEGKTHPLAGI